MIIKFLSYFIPMFVVSVAFFFIVMGHEIIDHRGSSLGRISTVGYVEFLNYCIFTSIIPLGIGSGICTLLTAKIILLRRMFVIIVYGFTWLITSILLLEGGAVNWGTTWDICGIFLFFIYGNIVIGLSFLLVGVVLSEMLITRYDKSNEQP